jgi:hypothetical protein
MIMDVHGCSTIAWSTCGCKEMGDGNGAPALELFEEQRTSRAEHQLPRKEGVMRGKVTFEHAEDDCITKPGMLRGDTHTYNF